MACSGSATGSTRPTHASAGCRASAARPCCDPAVAGDASSADRVWPWYLRTRVGHGEGPGKPLRATPGSRRRARSAAESSVEARRNAKPNMACTVEQPRNWFRGFGARPIARSFAHPGTGNAVPRREPQFRLSRCTARRGVQPWDGSRRTGVGVTSPCEQHGRPHHREAPRTLLPKMSWCAIRASPAA